MFMSPRYSFNTLRQYLKLTDDNFDQLASRSKKSWAPCSYVLILCAVLIPVAVAAAIGAFARGESFPVRAAAFLLVLLVFYFGMKLMIRLSNWLTERCIQAAMLKQLEIERTRS
jgi:hypothetical protein